MARQARKNTNLVENLKEINNRFHTLCYLCLPAYGGVQHVLTIWVTCRQELLTLCEHLVPPGVHVVCVAHLFSFLCLFFYFVYLPLVFRVPMLSVSQDCPFLICHSVFSNVYCASFNHCSIRFSKCSDGMVFDILHCITELKNTQSLIHTTWRKHSSLY
jgi:hypothetical protein